jgi:hypothetical protein
MTSPYELDRDDRNDGYDDDDLGMMVAKMIEQETSMKEAKKTECAWNAAYAAEQWREIAERAVQNGQSEVDFVLSCHISNRPVALKAYRAAKARMNLTRGTERRKRKGT